MEVERVMGEGKKREDETVLEMKRIVGVEDATVLEVKEILGVEVERVLEVE